MKKSGLLFKFLVIIFIIFVGINVVLISKYVRFWVDDLCSSRLLYGNGYFKSQVVWWNNWTGRFSFIALLDFFQLFGQIGSQVLPLILYILLIASNVLFAPITVLYLINSPSIIQTFFWMSGSLIYTIPFVFLNTFLSILFAKYKKYYPLLTFVLLFIATGFSEMFGIATLGFLIFLKVIYYFSKAKDKKQKYKIINIAFVSVLTSLLFMKLSPGNAARNATLTKPESFVVLVKNTLLYSKWYLIHLLYIKTFVVSSLLVLTSVPFYKKKTKLFKRPKIVILISLLFLVSVVLLVVGVNYAVVNWEPAERVMSIAMNFVFAAILVTCFAFWDMVKNNKIINFAKILSFVLLVLLFFEVSSNFSRVKKEVKDYATNWDNLSMEVSNLEKGDELYIDNFPAVGKLDDFKMNKGWVGSCLDGYFKDVKIIVKE